MEADALYDLLENDVIPTFYDRGADRTPRKWVDRMKTCIGSLCHFVNTHRMVSNYVERFYIPNHEHFRALADNNAARGRALATAMQRIRNEWRNVVSAKSKKHLQEAWLLHRTGSRARAAGSSATAGCCS